MDEFNLSDTQAEKETKHIQARYQEYKEAFWEQEKPNTEKVSFLIANNVLQRLNTNPFFGFSLGEHLTQSIVQFGKFLKDVVLIENELQQYDD